MSEQTILIGTLIYAVIALVWNFLIVNATQIISNRIWGVANILVIISGWIALPYAYGLPEDQGMQWFALGSGLLLASVISTVGLIRQKKYFRR